MPLNLTLPTVGGSRDLWGSILNAALTSTQTAVNNLETTATTIDDKVNTLTPRVTAVETAVANTTGVPRYDSVAARDAAIPTPTAGQLAYTPTTGVFIYHANHWVPLPGTLVMEAVASSAQTMTTPGPVAVTFGTNRFLPFGQTRTTNLDRYTPPWAGRYQVRVLVPLAVNATGGRSASLYLNGTGGTPIPGSYDATPAGYGTFPMLKLHGTLIANGGSDYVVAGVNSASASVDTIYAGTAAIATMSVTYLGPAYT